MVEHHHTERKLQELHEYVRHVFQLLVGWFTFFATVNYASMGWLAKPSTPSPSKGIVWIVAGMFITQNVLGLIACSVVRRYLLDRDAEVLSLERSIASASLGESASPGVSSVPARLYSRTIDLMAWALAAIMVAWCVLAVISP